MAENTVEATNPKDYYEGKKTTRKQYEDRAENFAKVTVPSLMRDGSWKGSSTSTSDYSQSFGALLVNNLVSKVGMTLFPPNTSAFRYTPDKEALQTMVGDNEKAKQEIKRSLGTRQNTVNAHLEGKDVRRTVFGAMSHMTVVSSCVIENVEDSGYKVHTLRNFVVDLDHRGVEYKICIEEQLTKLPDDLATLNLEFKEVYLLHKQLEEVEDGKWVLTQSIDGEPIEGEQTFADKDRPFAYFGWSWSSGDEYHRPFMENYYDDFLSLNTYHNILTKGSLHSAKSFTMVDERAGRTRARDVVNARMGDVIQGSSQDVSSFNHNKNYDYQIAIQMVDKIEQRLSYSFLFEQGLQRNAERVTAEEIRKLGQNLEQALATFYAVVSNTMIKRFVGWAESDLSLQEFKAINVEMVTGLSALGKQVETQALLEYVTYATNFGFIGRINQGELALRLALGSNIPTEGLLMSDDEYAKKQKAEQDAMAQQQGSEEFAKTAGQNLATQAPQQ